MEQTIHNISIRAFNELMKKNKPFTKTMLGDEIRNKGGILRMGICITVRDYFEEKEERGYISHVGEGYYLPTKKALEALEVCPNLIENGIEMETVEHLRELQLALSSGSDDEYKIKKILWDNQRKNAGLL